MAPTPVSAAWRSDIHPLRSGEAARLIATIDAVCGEGQWMATRRYEPTPAWEHALSQPDCACHLLLVTVANDYVVGLCCAFRDPARDAATIGLGLRQEYCDRGLGTQMLRQTLRWAQARGFARSQLTTRPDNARAVHVFRKLGFVSTGRSQQGQMEMVCQLTDLAIDRETLP